MTYSVSSAVGALKWLWKGMPMLVRPAGSANWANSGNSVTRKSPSLDPNSLEPELGTVEGLEVAGSEIRVAPPCALSLIPEFYRGKARSTPPLGRLLQAPHHVVAHGGLALKEAALAGSVLGGLPLGGGVVHTDPDHAAGDHSVLDEVRVDVRGVRLDVHEHRLCPFVGDAVAGRNKTQRGCCTLVPFADAGSSIRLRPHFAPEAPDIPTLKIASGCHFHPLDGASRGLAWTTHVTWDTRSVF